MATLDCKKINTCLFSPCADPHTHSLHQLCGEEDHSPSTIKLTNKQHSFQIKPNYHLRLKSRPSHFHQQFNTVTQIGSCDSSTFTFTSSIRHKLDSLENTSSSAHSKTTGNCRDSESQYSENDQSGNANASARPSIKRKRVHKLSERRRDRINKRLRALRNLIPNCTKMDKADVLDEAIEYLKSLQLQLQIMPFCAGLCVPPTRVILPTQYPIIGAGAGCSALQLFGLPFAGYGTRLQMPMNALPVESPRRSAIKDAQSLRWF